LPNPTLRLDASDQRILSALHELEYDPSRHRVGGWQERISPVPYYLLYAAAVQLVKPVPGHRSWPSSESNLLARVEGLKTLGFVRAAERNWPTFTIREMRDGRFISVNATRSTEELLGGRSKKSPVTVAVRQLTYEVRLGWLTDLADRLKEVGYHDSPANQIETMHSVLHEFACLTWIHANETDIEKWYKSIGSESQPRTHKYSDCCTLTPKGIAYARSFDSPDNESGNDPAPTELPAPLPSEAFIEPKAAPDTQDRTEQSLPSQHLSLNEEGMFVDYAGQRCKFPTRRLLLFNLLKIMLDHPGRRVSFETLRGPQGPWHNRGVGDSSIRGAVSRLREHLRASGLEALASAISTMTDDNNGYVYCDPEELEASDDDEQAH
jgi:DNA-binding winged helix-turn-helix (wHTH) protein